MKWLYWMFKKEAIKKWIKKDWLKFEINNPIIESGIIAIYNNELNRLITLALILKISGSMIHWIITIKLIINRN